MTTRGTTYSEVAPLRAYLEEPESPFLVEPCVLEGSIVVRSKALF